MLVEGSRLDSEERRAWIGIPLLYLDSSKPAPEKDFIHMLLMFPFSFPDGWTLLSFISNLALVDALGILLIPS